VEPFDRSAEKCRDKSGCLLTSRSSTICSTRSHNTLRTEASSRYRARSLIDNVIIRPWPDLENETERHPRSGHDALSTSKTVKSNQLPREPLIFQLEISAVEPTEYTYCHLQDNMRNITCISSRPRKSWSDISDPRGPASISPHLSSLIGCKCSRVFVCATSSQL
jgi:hypothetical protein